MGEASTGAFSLDFLRSLHSQTQFFFYKFKIYVQSNDCVLGDLAVSQKTWYFHRITVKEGGF